MSRRSRALIAAVGLSFAGCTTAVTPGDDAGPASARDTGSADDAWVQPPPYLGEVDLLLMIDDSNSMTEEQRSVVDAMPRLVTQLATGDLDFDGSPDFSPASSLHVGIVDSDMGLGTVSGISSCDPGLGDDGLMQIRARYALPGCMSDYGPQYPGNVFAFGPGSAASAAQLAQEIGCVATVGTDGCGFEMSLEASLKAISLDPDRGVPAWTRGDYVPPVFASGTRGHGNDPATNGAFLRGGSVLGVLLVTDEDDCSSDDFAIFALDDVVDLNRRCQSYASRLFPIDRYVDGLLGLRADATRLVFAPIAGVPPEVAGRAPSEVLAHPDMVERFDPVNPSRMLPACVTPGGRGVAFPAVRVTRVAEGLASRGARTTVQSICATDFAGAFDALAGEIGNAIDGAR